MADDSYSRSLTYPCGPGMYTNNDGVAPQNTLLHVDPDLVIVQTQDLKLCTTSDGYQEFIDQINRRIRLMKDDVLFTPCPAPHSHFILPLLNHKRKEDCTFDDWHAAFPLHLLPQSPVLSSVRLAHQARVVEFHPTRVSALPGVAFINLKIARWGVNDALEKPFTFSATGVREIILRINWPGYSQHEQPIPIWCPRMGDTTNLQLAYTIMWAYIRFFQVVFANPHMKIGDTKGFTLPPGPLHLYQLRLLRIVEVEPQRNVWSADIYSSVGC